MIVVASIGATGIYLLFVWLLSAAIGSWVSERKGYGERVGLAFGLLLTAAGLLIVLLLPGRPGSRWKEDGWLPRRSRVGHRSEGAEVSGPRGPGAVGPGSD
jgi:hypothetical protein